MNRSHPPLIWWNGRIVPWSDATVHVTSETAMRGTNVFEGLRAYWQQERRQFAFIALKEHLDRLSRSAAVLCLPADHLIGDLRNGIRRLATTLNNETNLYLRPTIYLDFGDYTAQQADLSVGAFISCRSVESRSDRPIVCATSSWERVPDRALPTLAKIGAAYTAFRLARMEAAAAGADEAILLNAAGKVAETPGAAVFLVRRGQVVTPPISDGVLEGITRRIAIELLGTNLGLPVVERSICRSELYIADELFLCGTLDEIRSIEVIDRRRLQMAPGPVTQALRKLYLDLCEGRTDGDVWWLQ
jgi:branched-chain amino acid aminotransferase